MKHDQKTVPKKTFLGESFQNLSVVGCEEKPEPRAVLGNEVIPYNSFTCEKSFCLAGIVKRGLLDSSFCHCFT
jgi:hypothetical protein